MSGKRKTFPLRQSLDSGDEEEATTSKGCSDYEDVASPSSSSTASEPVYVRQPGFSHHAHALEGSTKGKKKKNLISLDAKDVVTGVAPTTRPKLKKEPLPMKLRALPQSFWQQPNVASNVSPAVFPVLPPLFSKEPLDDVTEIRPVTPPDERERQKSLESNAIQSSSIKTFESRVVTMGNPELLLRLFDRVETTQRSNTIKRGRPKKPAPIVTSRSLRVDDPCLMSMVSESLLPLLPTSSTSYTNFSTNSLLSSRQPGRQTLTMVSLMDGDKAVSLPALNVDHNYSQLLSELVVKL